MRTLYLSLFLCLALGCDGAAFPPAESPTNTNDPVTSAADTNGSEGGDAASASSDAGNKAPGADTVGSPSDTSGEGGESTTSDGGNSNPGDASSPPECDPTPVPLTLPYFTEISDESGIRVDNYISMPQNDVPINDHSRLAFGDINGDGLDDIVMHNLFPNAQAGIPFEHLVFLNNGDGTFTDFSTESGLRHYQVAFFAFGDLDNDGDQDIFGGLDIPLGSPHEVLLNDGTGHFLAVENSGLEAEWNTAAAAAILADFNGDAILDLFLGNGSTFATAADSLWYGNGDGTFMDATSALQGKPLHPSNGAVACDYDSDGDLDIFVSTYGVSVNKGHNILWENDEGYFTNVAMERGFATLETGNYWLESTGNGTASEGVPLEESVGSNGFGIACADINGDGWLDIYLTTISHPVDSDYSRKWSDPSQVLINQGPDGNFSFKNEYLSLGLPFNEGDVDGAAIDFDNDGRIDLSTSRDNKYESNYASEHQKGWFGLAQQLPDGTFTPLTTTAGINRLDTVITASLQVCTSDETCPSGEICFNDKCRTPCAGDADCTDPDEMCHAKGICKLYKPMKKAQNHAWADIDKDGDLDLLVGGRDTGGGRPNFLFRNDIGSERRWLGIHFEGDGQAINRDAIGTQVRLKTDERVLLREVQSTRGMYNSTDGRAILFGLGETPCGYTIEVTWPDGQTVSFPPGTFEERRYVTVAYPDEIKAATP